MIILALVIVVVLVSTLKNISGATSELIINLCFIFSSGAISYYFVSLIRKMYKDAQVIKDQHGNSKGRDAPSASHTETSTVGSGVSTSMSSSIPQDQQDFYNIANQMLRSKKTSVERFKFCQEGLDVMKTLLLKIADEDDIVNGSSMKATSSFISEYVDDTAVDFTSGVQRKVSTKARDVAANVELHAKGNTLEDGTLIEDI